ncbi:hypothetical protein LJR219_001368 [Phenylobacterium sp. LjRoot219]
MVGPGYEPNDPKAPILIVGGADNPFSAYYPELLKAEGLNLFTAMRAQDLTAEALADRQVVLVVSSLLSPAAIAALEDWVRAGGLLVAMRPQGPVLELMGFTRTRADALRHAYLLASPSLQMSRGIVNETLRVHASADLWEPLPAAQLVAGQDDAPVTVAQLYADSTTALPHPAVTVRRIGRGYGAAFAFDLARSVALTRQGNPVWAGKERDGSLPRRPNDLFFPDYLNLDKIGVPQADEQQRLLANLILSAAGAPLPRFWYLPNGKRAAIIMTGDDHATTDGTAELFARLAALSPAGCRLEAWECLRATAYVTPATDLSAENAERFRKMGFEVGVHVDTRCRNQDNATLSNSVETQLRGFHRKYADLPRQTTHRIHCIVWNGWADLARIQRQNGIRLDLNYYHWPPPWLDQRPGFMTGSGFPMPFIDSDGSVLDIYQAASHLVDESGVPQLEGVRFMVERALGPEQFFGAFGTHYDHSDRYEDVLIQVAQQHGVPLVSAEQMLSWLDGRNGSRFAQLRWKDSKLRFDVRLGAGAEAASVMLPAAFAGVSLRRVTCAGKPVEFAVQTIKGLDVAFLAARPGQCEATYGPDARPLRYAARTGL